MVDGTQSDFFKINAGVPQGSVLAPTLFLLHINDLLSIPVDAPEDPFPTNTVSYADDTNLIKSTIYKSSLQASECRKETLPESLLGATLTDFSLTPPKLTL